MHYLLIIAFLLIIPINSVLADSQHYTSDEIKEGVVFISDDSLFKLEIPKETYNQSLDVYLYHLSSDKIKEINPVSDIFSYYIYSDEINDQSEITLTVSYSGSHTDPKTVYYFDPQKNQWLIASNKAFERNLKFQINGKKNKLLIVGTNLAGQVQAEEKSGQDFITYSFDVDSADSQLKTRKVCRPYLNSYFKSNRNNDEAEVKKLQTFLREYEGFSQLPSTGYYGNITYGSVKIFQERYSEDILDSWGMTQGNGWVLKTTLAKINQLYCEVYNKDNFFYELSLPYELPGKNAKNAYYLDDHSPKFEEFRREENQIKLESFDNTKTKIVTAVTDKERGQVILGQDSQAWAGEASWYAWKGGLFAASRDFPKGTRLKVTNQSNSENRGKSVIVTINDYGPETWTNRIIDLDKAAYDKIGNLKGGVMPVKIEVVK